MATRKFFWGGEGSKPSDGPPATPAEEKLQVQRLFNAAYDFSTWTQVPVQNPRAVEAFCEDIGHSPEEKMEKIMGSSTTGDAATIEFAMWKLLDTAIRIRVHGLDMRQKESDPEHEEYSTFTLRIDAMVAAFKINKSLVKNVVTDAQFMTRFVLKPYKECNMKESNKRVNKKKQEYIREGQPISLHGAGLTTTEKKLNMGDGTPTDSKEDTGSRTRWLKYESRKTAVYG
ncbi:hypothetical protein F5X68DRAFT_233640 [Plectosphaerella plurivora]|uniref:Uncharacterized protein n=1 Tax=Plectosphaerella plurivora TaxID=936078 RepID=A0A9P9AAM9_9PEZI|nr:hypothetical protein F5X68DRAFT_233640 [Plectosphaerella plurivora]